jgi:hypothetical protein
LQLNGFLDAAAGFQVDDIQIHFCLVRHEEGKVINRILPDMLDFIAGIKYEAGQRLERHAVS